MGLRELVDAWQRISGDCSRVYDATLLTINRELDAVGGYATTRADTHGLCQAFHRGTDGWRSGVARAGERYGGIGPLANTIAPHHPEVGDRCLELERAWRKLAMESSSSVDAVRQYIRKQCGSLLEPENVALALCKSEMGERAACVRWLREIASGHLNVHDPYVGSRIMYVGEIADAVERGDHLSCPSP